MVHLYQTAKLHRADQLSRVCLDFIFRNFSRVSQGEAFSELDDFEKESLRKMVVEEREKRMLLLKKEEEDVDSQGQHSIKREDVREEGMAV